MQRRTRQPAEMQARSSRELTLAAFKGQRPRKHRELHFSEELQVKQMVRIQLVEYFCTLIKPFLCGLLNFPSLNEHQPAQRQLSHLQTIS